MKHPLDDDIPLLNIDNTPYTEDQRYGFFLGLAEFKRTQYQRDRVNAYPDIGDQLDMLWHMMAEGEIPGKESLWFKKIEEIKVKYPKSL